MNDNIKYEVERFQSALIPFGYGNVKAAVETSLEGGHDGEWLADQITQWIEDTGVKMDEVDPNYVAYDSLLQEARNDIDSLTGVDILNDTTDQVEVYGNYLCTMLDYSEEAKEELGKILKKISEEDETAPIKWLKQEIDF